MEDLAAELPEREPRFVALIAKEVKPDGRITYPLMCIFVCPNGIYYIFIFMILKGCKPDHNLMYTSSVGLITNAGKFGKVFEFLLFYLFRFLKYVKLKKLLMNGWLKILVFLNNFIHLTNSYI